MASSPNFAASGLIAAAALPAAANTTHDGTGTNVNTLYTGSAVASQIDAIAINAIATTTAGMIRFFISTDGGTTKRKLGELKVAAVTPSASVPAFADVWYPPRPIPVPDANTVIFATTHNAEAFHAQAYGAKFS